MFDMCYAPPEQKFLNLNIFEFEKSFSCNINFESNMYLSLLLDGYHLYSCKKQLFTNKCVIGLCSGVVSGIFSGWEVTPQCFVCNIAKTSVGA